MRPATASSAVGRGAAGAAALFADEPDARADTAPAPALPGLAAIGLDVNISLVALGLAFGFAGFLASNRGIRTP